MSDSAQDQEVENMLSSVRRLVSNELPRKQRSNPAGLASALVLTEAQRVEPNPPMQSVRGMTLEERIAELEAAVSGQTDEWEPDGSEDQMLHRPDRIVYKSSRTPDEQEQRKSLRLSEIARIKTGPANVSVAQDGTAPDSAEKTLGAKDDDHSQPTQTGEKVSTVHGVEGAFADAVARDVAAVVAEMAEKPLITETDFKAALAEAVRDPAETRGQEPQRAEASAQEDAAQDTEPELEASPEEVENTQSESLSSRSEETTQSGFDEDGVQALTEPEIDEPDPEAEHTDDDGSVALSEDTPEDPSTETIEIDAEATGVSEEPDALAEDDGAQDVSEEALHEPVLQITENELRQMIAAMIRHELQGELGERITRNVRKLVRQEVHRALSVRDLE